MFAIAANGFANGPAQALRDYLLDRDADVVTIFHPLTPEQGHEHLVTTYASGRQVRTRRIRLPLRAPLSFALDPFVPFVVAPVKAWFGFNPLASARGLVQARLERARTVVHWAVDFVPDRFGAGTPATRVYDRLDRLCCRAADARVEVSAAAHEGRNARHRLVSTATPTYIVPMGAWLDRVPQVPQDGYRRRRVVYLGHLVPRQGVAAMLEALAVLRSRGETIAADVIGSGPQNAELRRRARELDLDGIVRFHGFVEDHREVERLLAAAAIAVAPYEPSEATFTRYADPGKLKAYLAAGLPIVLTDVPPNAGELAREGGAEIVDFAPAAIADAIARGLASPERWQERSNAAREHARRFDWAVLLPELLAALGLET